MDADPAHSFAADLPEDARCLQCGYALRGLTGCQCPECGKPFDPREPFSYSLGKRYLIGSFSHGPPGKKRRLFMLLFAAIVLIDISCPGSWRLGILVYGLLFAPIGFLVIIDLAIRVLVGFFKKKPAFDLEPMEQRRLIWEWLTIPLCFALIVSAVLYPWPTWIRFQLSREAFDRVVRSQDFAPGSRWIGLFPVSKTIVFESGEVFFITGDEFLESVGFLRSEHGNRAVGRRVVYPKLRMGGHWYIAKDDF